MSADQRLWYFMIATGVAAAVMSLYAMAMDRYGGGGARRKHRFALHIASYILMSVSILTFAARGFIGP